MMYNDTMSKAHQRAVEKYNDKTYDRLTIRIKKTDIEEIKAAIGTRSINGYVNEAIREKIEREKPEQ